MKTCRKCQGCGCPSCLGTGSGYARDLIMQWGASNNHEYITPEEVRNLPVVEQRRAQDHLGNSLELIQFVKAKRSLHAQERDFHVNSEPRLVPADQPHAIRVRLELGKVQVRAVYGHALEEIRMIMFQHKDLKMVLGQNSERLFMVEFKLRGKDSGRKLGVPIAQMVQAKIVVTSLYLSNVMGWSSGTRLNHETVLRDFKEAAEWIESVERAPLR